MPLLTPFTMMKLIRIRTKVESGAITMSEAEAKAKPFMKKLNSQAAKNAKKTGESYTPISFEQFLWIQREAEKRKS